MGIIYNDEDQMDHSGNRSSINADDIDNSMTFLSGSKAKLTQKFLSSKDYQMNKDDEKGEIIITCS